MKTFWYALAILQGYKAKLDHQHETPLQHHDYRVSAADASVGLVGILSLEYMKLSEGDVLLVQIVDRKKL